MIFRKPAIVPERFHCSPEVLIASSQVAFSRAQVLVPQNALDLGHGGTGSGQFRGCISPEAWNPKGGTPAR